MLSRNFVLIQLMISVLNVNNVFFLILTNLVCILPATCTQGSSFVYGVVVVYDISSFVRYLQFCTISSIFVRYLQFYTISLVLYDISSFVRYPQSVSNVLTLYLQVEEKKAIMSYIILPLETNTFSTLVSLYVKPHLISQLYYCRRE